MDLERYPLNRFVVESGTPMVIDDVSLDPRWSPLPGAHPIRSWMGIPLRASGEVIGMLAIDSWTDGAYSEEDLEVADAFADLAAAAVRNARLFTTARRKIDELDAVNKIGAAVASRLEVDRLCEVAGQNLVEIFRLGVVYVALWDEEARSSACPTTRTTAGARVIRPSVSARGSLPKSCEAARACTSARASPPLRRPWAAAHCRDERP